MNGNTSLDSTCDQDYTEFLNEYLLQTNSTCNEPETQYEDGEMEAEWLVSAGYPELTKPFQQGIEIRSSELEHLLASLPIPHAKAIKHRVRALNYTVRGRTKNRSKRKPDIRDVFRDFDESSTGTRSRSATPDSLDSIRGDDVWGNTPMPSFVGITDVTIIQNTNESCSQSKQLKQKIRRTPSAPLKCSTSTDIFRGSQVRCDIPMNSSEGIELLGFSRIGTIHIPRNRSGSDPSCSIGRVCKKIIPDFQSENNTSSGDSSDDYLPNNAIIRPTLSAPEEILNNIKIDANKHKLRKSSLSSDGISFESMCRENTSHNETDTVDGGKLFAEFNSDICSINETEFKRLKPIFWLELAAIFDRNKVSLDKRKPFKKRRKEEGSLFGVSLNALIRRDQQITGMDSTLVPKFLEDLLKELIKRGSTEEGILRVAGQKHKTEIIYNELEANFYQKPEKVEHLLSNASVHELSALLKRWLRELPQPLLTCELIQLFYQSHALPKMDQIRALSILCQMLPHENRNTLRSLLKFLNLIINLKEVNKMDIHNVSTIIAPSFFPPRYIHPVDNNSIADQVKMAALCCRLTNTLITRGESLFQVFDNIIAELHSQKARQGKRVPRRINDSNIDAYPGPSGIDKRSAKSTDRHSSFNPNHVHRFVV